MVTRNRGVGTAPRQRSTAVGLWMSWRLLGAVGLQEWPWAPPDYPAPPPPTAASRAGHGRSLPSHQRLTPGCRGVAKHLPTQRGGAQRRDRDARSVRGQRGPPGRGRESTTVSCGAEAVFALRCVFRFSGTGLLGRSDPRAKDVSAIWERGGASWPPYSVPLGAVPARRRWAAS